MCLEWLVALLTEAALLGEALATAASWPGVHFLGRAVLGLLGLT